MELTIMGYLFEYTLETVCNGNKSEFSRRLGVEQKDIYRYSKRFRDGSGSIRATEAVLEMYWREGRSIDDVLQNYTLAHPGLREEVASGFCDDVIAAIRTSLENECRAAQDLARVLKSAEHFMAQMERAFCNAACKSKRDCATQCPCKRFAEFLNWLKDEMPFRSTPNKDL